MIPPVLVPLVLLVLLVLPFSAFTVHAQAIRQVGSINELRALNVYPQQTNITIRVRSYWPGIAGGGGDFKLEWDEGFLPSASTNVWAVFEAQNSGTVKGWWQRLEIEQPFDIRKAGAAVGPVYAARTRTAIQAILDAGLGVSIPIGRFYVDQPLTVSANSTIVGVTASYLAGPSQSSELTPTYDNDYTIKTGAPGSGYSLRMSDFLITAAVGLTNVGGLLLDSLQGSRFDNLVFQGQGTAMGSLSSGIKLTSTTDTKNNFWQNLHFNIISPSWGGYPTNHAAVLVDTSAGDVSLTMLGCRFYVCTYGVYHWGNRTFGPEFLACQFSGGVRENVKTQRTKRFRMLWCHTEESWTATTRIDPSLYLGLDGVAWASIEDIMIQHSSFIGLSTMTNLVVFGTTSTRSFVGPGVQFAHCSEAAFLFNTANTLEIGNNAYTSVGRKWECTGGGTTGISIHDGPNHFITSELGANNTLTVDGTVRVRNGMETRFLSWATNWNAVAMEMLVGTNFTIKGTSQGTGSGGSTNVNIVLVPQSGYVQVSGDGYIDQDLTVGNDLTVTGNVLLNSQLTMSHTTAGASPLTVDFLGKTYETVNLSGNFTFTASSNRAAGRTKTFRIICDGSDRTLAFNASWVYIGSASPASISASKTGILTLTCFGTAETDVLYSYAVSP